MTSASLHERATIEFAELLGLDGLARQRRLDSIRECDAELYAYIVRLLENDRDDTDFEAAARLVSIASAPDSSRPPTTENGPPRISGYGSLEQIGSGGMGVVYRATQAVPSREVAIKVLKEHIAAEAAEALFRREAEMLARLDHPGIARVYTVGRLEDARFGAGMPYIVMELIRGVAIDTYVVDRSCDIRETVRMLVELCGAIDHAHQRGVLHRDLKPQNVLVEESGRLAVVDFGIARPIMSLDDYKLEVTAAFPNAHALGTAGYLSPEQVPWSKEVIDTRTDVHAIGLIAFKLFTGLLPYAPKQASISSALAALERDEPRSIRSITTRFPIDLDTIVMKAIRKDPNARYSSAAMLGDDLQRWLDGRPVEARRPTLSYSLLRLAARHRVASTGVAAAFVFAVIAFVSVWAAVYRADVAREAALHDAQRAEAMSGFLEATVFGADPEIGGASLTFLDALTYTSARLPDDLAKYPDLQADVHSLIGYVLMRHGRFSDASVHADRAYSLREESLGPNHPLTGESMKIMGELASNYGGRPNDAVMWLRRAIDIAAESDDADQRICWTWCSLGWALLDAGNVNEARDAFQIGRRAILSSYGNIGHVYAGRADRGLAACALQSGHLDDARRLGMQSIDLQAASPGAGQEYPLARAYLTFSEICVVSGHHEAVIDSLDRASSLLDPLITANHPLHGRIAVERARVALALGQVDSATAHATRGLSVFRESLAASHWRTLEAEALSLLGGSVSDPRPGVLAPFDKSLERYQTVRGARHPRVRWLIQAAADTHAAAGHGDKAEILQESIERRFPRRP